MNNIQPNTAKIPVTIRKVSTETIDVDVTFPAYYKTIGQTPGTEDNPQGFDVISYYRFDSISKGVCLTALKGQDPRDKPTFSVKAVPQGLHNEKYLVLLTNDEMKSSAEEFSEQVNLMEELLHKIV